MHPLKDVGARFLGRMPESDNDYNAIGIRLAKAIKRKSPYTGYYIKGIIERDFAVSGPISKAIENLNAELDATPPTEEYRPVTVLVPYSFKIPEGTVIQRDARVCVCGTTFIPTAWNQINHTRACAKMRAQLRRRGK